MTLRDGMHPKRHQITLEQMVAIAKGLDEAGVPLIEISHGDGLGGSSFQYGMSKYDEIELIRAGQIEDAYARMLRGEVRYRFVIDNASLADAA